MPPPDPEKRDTVSAHIGRNSHRMNITLAFQLSVASVVVGGVAAFMLVRRFVAGAQSIDVGPVSPTWLIEHGVGRRKRQQ